MRNRRYDIDIAYKINVGRKGEERKMKARGDVNKIKSENKKHKNKKTRKIYKKGNRIRNE